MRLLLDTHVWLWSAAAPERLPRRVRSALARAGPDVWLSPLSVFELLVLAEKGRVRLDREPRAWVREALERSGLREAPMTHAVAIRSRELLSSHPDPVDRILVATALVFELRLVTADAALIRSRACPLLACD